jgi:hypothetical protein
MKYPESKIIFDKMKAQSKLNDEAMGLIGITIDKIDRAMKQCLDAGMSRQAAVKTIYKLWKFLNLKINENNLHRPNRGV